MSILTTVLAVAISAGTATAVPWVLWRARARSWALAWSVTALFAVTEMWMAEYRLGLATAWETAYWRDIVQQPVGQEQERQSLQSRYSNAYFGDQALSELTQFAQKPHEFGYVRFFGQTQIVGQRNNRNIRSAAFCAESATYPVERLSILSRTRGPQTDLIRDDWELLEPKMAHSGGK
jgi:hypothetical protein